MPSASLNFEISDIVTIESGNLFQLLIESCRKGHLNIFVPGMDKRGLRSYLSDGRCEVQVCSIKISAKEGDSKMYVEWLRRISSYVF